MAALSSMRNIGKEIERKLNAIGITTTEELVSLGSKNAFFQMRMTYPEVCLVHLYTLQAAIENIQISQLSEETKAELKRFSDGLK